MTSLHARPAQPLTDPVALLEAQLRAVDLWHTALHATKASAEAPGLSREARLDAARRLGVRRREQEVLLERAACAMGEDGPLLRAVPARAVVAHRHAWTRDKLASELASSGVTVLATVDNGADAVALCVAEQPALLVLDETLAMRSGAEVAHEVRQFCPHTVIGGYVGHPGAVGPMLEAGASPVFTRRVPPAEVTAQLLALLPA